MVKSRLAIVISKQMAARPGLCTIVPLSTKPPRPPAPFHCQIDPQFKIPEPWGNRPRWVKGDMVYAARFHRLDLLRLDRGASGRRIYLTDTISKDDLERVQRCVLNGLSLTKLTKHL